LHQICIKPAIDSLKLRSGLSLPTFTQLVEITIESANVIMSFGLYTIFNL
jgi:hypothetical protein